MQNLLVIADGQVIVQVDNNVYTDTYENFILDGGEELPENFESIDYNQTLNTCWVDGNVVQKFPEEYCERILGLAPVLCEAFEARKKAREESERVEREESERIKREQEEAERLANMTEEEKAAEELTQAKAERAEAVSRIIVEVDGMKFDGDEESQSRIGRTIAAAVALGVDLTTEKRTWVLADNSIAEVTISQLAEALRLAGDAQTALWTVPYTDV